MKNKIRQTLILCFQAPRLRTRTRLLSEIPSWQSWLSKSRGSFSWLHTDQRVAVAGDDNRTRLSRLWVPTGGITPSSNEDSHSKLIRAGFLRPAHSGVFHLLPLGRRVQDKLEALIDKHMSKLVASKLALSSISSQELWTKSGRLGISSELFRFRDRKDVGYLLAPTHEEEITSLVGSTVKSYKELPLRLYQISRKYRDELRPRHGLLRSREFIMKDLYTFDYNTSQALATYDEVRKVYAELFDELKVPYLIAQADSGDMGGNLSHEFHFPTTQGEDHVVSCRSSGLASSCGYVANEELAESALESELNSGSGLEVWRGISRDRRTLINVWYPSLTPGRRSKAVPEINIHAVKKIIPELDSSIENPIKFWVDPPVESSSRRLLNLVDGRLPDLIGRKIESNHHEIPYWPNAEEVPEMAMRTITRTPTNQRHLNLLRIQDGDPCPTTNCSGSLKVEKAIELGHTFHLGTRYSDPLKAMVTVPTDLLKNETSESDPSASTPVLNSTQEVPMQMGCHGIGVSRIIGAVTDTLADDKGLNWPRVIAPYEVVVLASKGSLEDVAEAVYDTLSGSSASEPERDVILDDRTQSFAWKMRDADLVGYSIIVVVGRSWEKKGMCEVQCRRLDTREEVPLELVPDFVDELLNKL